MFHKYIIAIEERLINKLIYFSKDDAEPSYRGSEQIPPIVKFLIVHNCRKIHMSFPACECIVKSNKRGTVVAETKSHKNSAYVFELSFVVSSIIEIDSNHYHSL